ncbi:MAG: FAD-dependent oxidoreductase [Ignisphaera sp.]|nr:FAD-dependent oxidoreductase [Ignisphaera sp.]MDW8085170.1 FAD-dependent oxidoreductase [Ignisphaera sp.]
MDRVVVIGGGAAGASAAARAKRLNPAVDVVVIEASSMITHAPCAIPYAIAGIARGEMFTYTPGEFERERGIRVMVNSRVTDIDVDKRIVHVRRGSVHDKLEWSRLVIATGAVPSTPGIPGTNLKGVVTLRHPAYVDEVRRVLEGTGRVAIVGGSYLGIEMAEALLSMGRRVLLIEKEDRLMPAALDTDMSEILASELTSKGVELHLNEGVVELAGGDRVERVVTDKGSYSADAVILATGVKPNVELALQAGVKLGSTGAVHVNEYMETNIEGVYAAGDVAEKHHRILKKSVWIPLATTANKEGQVAGANSIRSRAIRFPGVVGTVVTRFFSMYIAKTGLSTREAVENGIKVESRTIKARTKAHYFPGAVDVYVKLIIESSTERVLGAQVIGWDHAVAGYIDVASAAITSGATIEDLFFLDIGYTPSTAPVWHPLIVAARVLSKGRF